MKTLCIYHGNCADGFTAAWAVRQSLGDDVEFFAATHGHAAPDVAGRHVVIVDFSYKRAELIRMSRIAESVLILDHHASARDDLERITEYKGVSALFDMERSGARIAWDYYHPDDAPPQLLLHVEDRDLWRFAIPRTREIQAALFSYPYDFDTWDRLMYDPIEELAKEGIAIERKHHKDVAELVRVVTRHMKIDGRVIPVANLPYTLASDAGNLLAEAQPFAACYWDTPDGRVFSLRSTPNGEDVAKIATKYGGGGHPHASGFRMSFEDARALEV